MLWYPEFITLEQPAENGHFDDVVVEFVVGVISMSPTCDQWTNWLVG